MIVTLTGVMCGGKTDRLVRCLLEEERSGRKIQAYRPMQDTRDFSSDIIARTGLMWPAKRIEHATYALEHLDAETQVVAFDEVNMLPGVVDVALILRKKGITVYAAGLSTKWDGEPFEPLPLLLAYSDRVLLCNDTLCARCGKPASYNKRLSNSKEDILPGEGYQPVCANCFDSF